MYGKADQNLQGVGGGTLLVYQRAAKSRAAQFIHRGPLHQPGVPPFFFFIYDSIPTKPLNYFGAKYVLWVKTAQDRVRRK